MYHKRLNGLWLRGGVYQFRIRVPSDVVSAIGKTHINRSLGTASYRDALSRSRQLAIDFADTFEMARRGGSSTMPVSLKPASRAPTPEAKSPIGRLTLSDAWDRYLADPGSGRTRKTTMAYETVRNLVASILGKDAIVAELGRQDCRKVMEVLRHLPSNYGKKWPDMAPEDISKMARNDGIPPMSAANCNGYMSRWSGMLNWLVKEELAVRNPCIGLRVADPIPAREKRLPFSLGQLERIFTGAPFDQLADVSDGLALPETPAHFYVPLIALFSGLRQNEICQQTVDDVVEIDSIFCLVVKPDASLGKRIKTAASERMVPLHPALIRAGLLRHWRTCRASNEQRLWPELELDRFGYASAYFSKWFGRHLTKTGARAERTSFHSFRHCFRDALRAGRVDREVAFALGGWTNAGSGSAVGDIYGSGHGIGALNEAIAKIGYDVPALSTLLDDRR